MHEIFNWVSLFGIVLEIIGFVLLLNWVRDFIVALFPDSRSSHRFREAVENDTKVIGISFIIIGLLAQSLVIVFHSRLCKNF
jgi:ribose 5-phosphate isomerase RpiB